MVCCVAWGCSNQAKMYGFPTDTERRKKWLSQLSRSNLTLTKDYNSKYICEGSGVKEGQVALIAAFSSSALLGLVSVILLLTISHRFSMGSDEFAGQSSTVILWLLNQAVQRVADDQLKLEELKAQLRIDDAVLQQWVTEVQHWPEANSSLEGEASREVILKKKIEGLYLSVMQRKHHLYRQTDSNKRRHKFRQKIAEEKAALSSAVEELCEQTDIILPAVDELLLTENFVWPWNYLATSKNMYNTVLKCNLYTKYIINSCLCCLIGRASTCQTCQPLHILLSRCVFRHQTPLLRFVTSKYEKRHRWLN
ncbi:uncharacterized protein LOC143473465 [Brachyhypopomus gauderio]|uniref:uncharacterized protein LOC143473465 n=1 Tax=Brachyhypopomus gauderio TaxID=698409 RepID=UPI00404112CD